MKILITGISGFVGSILARALLQQNHSVYGFVRSTTNIWRIDNIKKDLILYHVDLCDAQTVSSVINKIKPDIVYHLAAHGAYSFHTDENKIIETNILGTWNLLKATEKCGFELFINTGSSSEYGFKQHPMKETDLLEPNSFYSASKCSQTLLTQYFAKNKQLPIVTFRLFSVYGPLEEPSRLIPSTIMKCDSNEDLKLSNPETSRDFVFIHDVINAYLSCEITPNMYGEIFNIGSGIQTTIKEVVENIIKLTNSKSLCQWGAMPDRIWDFNTWVGDCTKSNKLLKWHAKTSLKKGLKQTIEWHNENK